MEKKLYEKPQIEILVFAPTAMVQTAEGYWDENGVWHPSGGDNDGDVVVTMPGTGDGGYTPFF